MSRALLNKLLAHSFANYQVLFNDRSFHSHNAHHLGSLFFLGASDDQLEKAYETMCKELDPYEPSPNEITLSNWRKHLGDKHYCKSYADFFKDQLSTNENQWQKKFTELLLDNKQHPIINGVIGGVAHPLIHIGYAWELDSQVVGIEALAMTAVCYNYLHEKVDSLSSPNSPSKSALEIFHNVRADGKLPIYDGPGVNNLEGTVAKHTDRLLSHYNQWKIDRAHPEKAIEELFDLTVYIYGATHKPDQIEYDFFLLHLLTSMHAIRTIQPHISDAQIFEHILYQLFYFALVIYTCQLRPKIDEQLIHDYSIDQEKKNWKYVVDRTINTQIIDEVHAVKVVRALRDAEKAYGSKNGLYLKTAVKTVDHLNLEEMWVGGSSDQRQLNILQRA